MHAQQVDNLGVARHADVRAQRDLLGLEIGQDLGVAFDEFLFEGVVAHAPEHPPDERAVSEGDDGALEDARVLGRTQKRF